MYPALARGHATAFLNAQTPHEKIEAWFTGPHAARAMSVMSESCHSKKPGRIIKRLTPIIKPISPRPFLAFWTRDQKMVMFNALSVAQENLVLNRQEAGLPVYSERSVFVTSGFIHADTEQVQSWSITTSNICHHALQRLVERDLATPDALPRHVSKILSITRNIGMAVMASPRLSGTPHSFVIPYGDGALIAVSMHVAPSGKKIDRTRDVVAVRTFLSPDMINADMRVRMEGFEEAFEMEAVTQGEHAAWVKHNAMPWSFAPERKSIRAPTA